MSALDEDIVLPRPMADVIAMVAEAFEVPLDRMLGPERLVPLVRARHVAMGILLHDAAFAGQRSLPMVARLFGKRDHTVVLHGRRNYETHCDAVGVPHRHHDPRERALLLAAHLGRPPSPARTAAPFHHPPAPEPREMQIHKHVACPAFTSTVFGPFDLTLAEFEALPPPMQAEGLALAMEQIASEHPTVGEDWILDEASRRLRLSPERLRMIQRGAEPYVLPDADALARRYDIEGEPKRSTQEMTAEGGFGAFAAARLKPRKSGVLDVPTAYAAYGRWCRTEYHQVLPRTNFGARLLALARAKGGTRQGDLLTGIVMVEGGL